MTQEEKDLLEERLERVENKAKETERLVNMLLEWVEKNVPKKPNLSFTDGPIMVYPKHSKLDYDLNINLKKDPSEMQG